MARKATTGDDEPGDPNESEHAKVENRLDSTEMETERIQTGAEQALDSPGSARARSNAERAIEPLRPHGEPWPEPTPEPMLPRARTTTVLMPPQSDVGTPPEMPRTIAPPPLVLGAIENPAHMPGPREIPAGSPEDAAPPPGMVPRGDSRSLRRGKQFALIYRVATYVISRCGTVGTRGQWRVVEYPTSAAAGHAYAQECSRFVSEGFSDYRE
jgi:hypothetical protein